ncbi:hypothetical protein [Streptomyces sp. NPDC039028]|uniref:hypothetical protein n=1 Tax=unclassified Streptomyces TaxID=2593676 RepID=UPI0034082859
MTGVRAYLVKGAALGLLGLGAAGCTGQAPAPEPDPTTSPAASAASAPERGRTEAAREEREKRMERVKSVLDTVSPDDPAFVMSGTERVGDGVHHRALLKRGAAYRLTLVCAGEGAVVPVVDGREIPAVPCDGVTVLHRITGAPAELPLTVTGRPGASGAIGWRIDALTT